MAYDKVFRKRVIEYKDAGHTFKEAEEAFGVDSKRYYSWKKQLEQTGSLESKRPKERRGKINKDELQRLLNERPDWYLREFAAELNVCLQAARKMSHKQSPTAKETVGVRCVRYYCPAFLLLCVRPRPKLIASPRPKCQGIPLNLIGLRLKRCTVPRKRPLRGEWKIDN
jgi:hypothetical protein